MGDVSDDQGGVFCASTRFSCSVGRVAAFQTDPKFGPKRPDVVGLYLSPPENAVVLCVDESLIFRF